MPFKDDDTRKAYMKEYSRKHYEENIERYKSRAAASNKKLRIRNRDFIKEIKESNPCTDCGEFYPYYVMHYDHIYDKNGSVSDLSRASSSLDRIQKEIDNCELVCANCHAERTFSRAYGEDTSEWI
jgi:hypothetical protein